MDIGLNVPWNAAWSSEERFEIRPCKYAGNRLSIWSPYSPGKGRPLFAKPHVVRQRKSIAEMRCTVCGEKTTPDDRWLFPFGGFSGRWWVTTESPVHRRCSDLALVRCPEIARRGMRPIPFPGGHTVLYAVIGGDATDTEFGVRTQGRQIIGHLKLAWRSPWFLPASMIAQQKGGVA